jgi:hypothetical protein
MQATTGCFQILASLSLTAVSIGAVRAPLCCHSALHYLIPFCYSATFVARCRQQCVGAVASAQPPCRDGDGDATTPPLALQGHLADRWPCRRPTEPAILSRKSRHLTPLACLVRASDGMYTDVAGPCPILRDVNGCRDSRAGHCAKAALSSVHQRANQSHVVPWTLRSAARDDAELPLQTV